MKTETAAAFLARLLSVREMTKQQENAIHDEIKEHPDCAPHDLAMIQCALDEHSQAVDLIEAAAECQKSASDILEDLGQDHASLLANQRAVDNDLVNAQVEGNALPTQEEQAAKNERMRAAAAMSVAGTDVMTTLDEGPVVPLEQSTEQEIQAKGLNAPRLTPDDIDDAIKSEHFHIVPDTQLTICTLILQNGFTVTGESACVSPENFDEEIGRNIARDNARKKIWELEGYLLKSALHDEGLLKDEPSERDHNNYCLAAITHEANRVYCLQNGDTSQPLWADVPEWQEKSAIEGVKFIRENLGAPAHASHDNWMSHKRAEGWVYGPNKDPEAKTHPCMVPFDELPPEQQFKDTLFVTIVETAIAGGA